MKAELDHQVQGRCWVGQDVDTRKPVYVFVRYKHRCGDVVDYYLTPMNELWEVKREGADE